MASKFVLAPHYTNLLRTPSEVHDWVKSIKAMKVDEKIQSMRTTFYDFDFTQLWDTNPDSVTYENLVLKMYSDISGHEYNLKYEPAPATQREIESPFPYNSGSNLQIGENLLGVASILKSFPVAPGSEGARVLEMGCGASNVGLTLARSGYHVTGVDIDPSCGDLIDYWAPRLNAEGQIEFVESTFETVDEKLPQDSQFDVILFFKSFHHCLYHHKLLEMCSKLLRPGGYLMLCAEPVHGNFYSPWSIRCDGTSIFAIAENGWMELGYDREYFHKAAKNHGFEFSLRNTSLEIPTMNSEIFIKI